MNEKLLQDIGLTPGETKVYFALSKLGQVTTGPIAKESGVSASKVYKILDKLEVKGLIGKIIKGGIQYYSALNPRQLLHYIEDKESELSHKKEEIKKLVAQLLANNNREESSASVLQGFKAVTNAFTNILDELQKGQKYRVLGGTYNDIPGLRPFFYKHHTRRASKGIRLEMLANHDMEGKLETSTKKLASVKYLSKELDQLMEIVCYNKSVFIVLWAEQPFGFLVHSEEINLAFNKYFELFWKK